MVVVVEVMVVVVVVLVVVVIVMVVRIRPDELSNIPHFGLGVLRLILGVRLGAGLLCR